MKRLIALMLCMSMLILPACAFTFEQLDMDKAASEELKQAEAVSDWAADEVQAADELGLVVPSCAFHMGSNITRLQFAQLAMNMWETCEGITVAPRDESPFTDCDDPEVSKAYSVGIVAGTGDGTFDPDGSLTREQLATMLYRVWQSVGGKVTPGGLEGYTDAASVSPWAADAVGAMAAAGIMKGTSETTLDPQASCTIEQSILLVYRLFSTVQSQRGGM